MNPLKPLVLGNLVIAPGRCGQCGEMRGVFVNVGGKTCCAVCVATKEER